MPVLRGVPVYLTDETVLTGFLWTTKHLRMFRRIWLADGRQTLRRAEECRRSGNIERYEWLMKAVRSCCAHARRLTAEIAACE